MEFFLDTTDTSEIMSVSDFLHIDGVTTNPSLIAKSGRSFTEVISSICQVVSGSVSAEVLSEDLPGMLSEAERLASIADNVCIKLPMTSSGLLACRSLSQDGVKTNVTLCFSVSQAILAAKAGATYVSPFVGRLDDVSDGSGIDLISKMRLVFDNYSFSTKILAASIRSVSHVEDVAQVGADVATVPPSLVRKMLEHPLTSRGLDIFLKDAKSVRT